MESTWKTPDITAFVLKTITRILPELAERSDVPIFVPLDEFDMNDFTGLPTRKKRLEEEGYVFLPVRNIQAAGVKRGLEALLQNEGSFARAKEVFHSPEFVHDPAFLDLVIDPTLKAVADKLHPTTSPVIIDCGHIDHNAFDQSAADLKTFEDGVILAQYLQVRGVQTKLAILFNEMHMLGNENISFLAFYENKDSKVLMGRDIQQLLYRQGKRQGLHHYTLGYIPYLEGFGISQTEWPNRVISVLEGITNLKARQTIQAYEKGGEPFKIELEEYDYRGRGLAYTVQIPNGDGGTRPFTRYLTSRGGAPLCAMMTAQVNKGYEQLGAQTVIVLRDQRWESAIRCGTVTGRTLYGNKAQVEACFYGTTPNGRVGIASHISL